MRLAKALITTPPPSKANCKPSRYCASYPATNQEHFQLAQQPQEGSPNPQKRKGHSRVSADHEDCRCQKKPIQLARPNRRGNVILCVS